MNDALAGVNLDRVTSGSGRFPRARHHSRHLLYWGLSKFWWLRSCEVGHLARVTGGRVIVDGSGRIRIGRRTRLMAHHAPIVLRAEPGATIDIGASVAVNYGTIVEASDRVTIGDNTSIGPYCVISDRSGDESHPITIGAGAWLATRVTVTPGSSVGAGSTVASGSLVDGHIPAGVLASGIPARVIRRLSDDESPDESSPMANGLGESHDARSEADDAPEAAVDRVDDAQPQTIGSGVLISDFTIDPLGPLLGSGVERLDVEVAPFGTVGPSLLAPANEFCDVAVVWTHAESTLPSLGRLRDGQEVTVDEIEGDVEEFAGLLRSATENFGVLVVPEWTRPPWDRGLGPTDERLGGFGHAYGVANHALRSAVTESKGIVILDTRRWIESTGARAYTERGWYEGKMPLSIDFFERAAEDIKSVVRARTLAPRKVLVVDLDNTLWGGVVGDDGPEGLRLGGHDSLGEAFADFQRRVRALKSRGVVLAIASKNDEQTAMAAIDGLDTMVLKRSDFVTWRINWNDKAQNIADMASELNIGLQSFVFIDDNPHERARVREALPEVLVPDLPTDPTLYCRALSELTCFDTLSESTGEDAERTLMYQVEAERQRSREVITSLDDWINDLEIRVTAQQLNRTNLGRAAQLLNKTNQMNLRTRRQSEAELWDWSQAAGHETWCVSVGDRLGEAGLTGVLSVAVNGDTAELVDFVMSCRVMGRRVERTMLAVAASAADRLGASTLSAELLPTPKNAPCARFFEDVVAAVDGYHLMPVDEFSAAPDGLDLAIESNAAEALG